MQEKQWNGGNSLKKRSKKPSSGEKQPEKKKREHQSTRKVFETCGKGESREEKNGEKWRNWLGKPRVIIMQRGRSSYRRGRKAGESFVGKKWGGENNAKGQFWVKNA